mmetsp:Transcript_66639/g.138916  ORF Transcript_66639/g.138916 Transcript_66639/m.138916 type:complete len:227 (-) Transcript_66639:340-1020(-)
MVCSQGGSGLFVLIEEVQTPDSIARILMVLRARYQLLPHPTANDPVPCGLQVLSFEVERSAWLRGVHFAHGCYDPLAHGCVVHVSHGVHPGVDAELSLEESCRKVLAVYCDCLVPPVAQHSLDLLQFNKTDGDRPFSGNPNPLSACWCNDKGLSSLCMFGHLLQQLRKSAAVCEIPRHAGKVVDIAVGLANPLMHIDHCLLTGSAKLLVMHRRGRLRCVPCTHGVG